MARDDWFRNKTWNAEIEAAFHQRLKRARDKSQYLRIQASTLAKIHPRAALNLLEQYFALGDHFDAAQAYLDRGSALVALGDLPAALASYEAAMTRERQFPNAKTQAYLDFACLVVDAGIERSRARALEILDAHQDRPMFPIDRFLAHGARALLLEQFGQMQPARESAKLAMAASRETSSGFRNHSKLGLVEDTGTSFAKCVAALAS